MKIVVVLCSIATFATAVPVNQENFIQPTNQPLRKRESKSALPDITSGLPEHEIENSPIDSNKKLEQGTSVETKGFRRPIIIKRKFAYHVYRDSDEEMAHAEPGEKCREQVKFKLCDHEPVLNSKNGIKSPTFKCMEERRTDDDMKNSIKMTKEAVEHLQRDLKRMDMFSPKMGNPHLEDIESNTALYHDIEIAREALEHVEENFKSGNSEENKVSELQIPKTQSEERLNRWREAIDNIHKNFEIVRNIEDAFKSDKHYSLILSNGRKADQSDAVEHLVHHKFTNENLRNKDDAYSDDVTLQSGSNKVEIAEKTSKSDDVANIGKAAENDMFISSSDYRKENMQLHSDSLKSEINSKDASSRSNGREMESEKYDNTVSKESTEYTPKKSNTLSKTPKNSEHEKTMNDHISDDYEIFPKVSSSSFDSLYKDVKIDNSGPIMKTASQERGNRNPIIKMKSVKEILENKKDQVKAATSIEEKINEYEERFFKSKASDMPEDGTEEKEYLDKNNNKSIESKEKQAKYFNSNMRLNNDQLEKSKPLPADNFDTKDQDDLITSHIFSLNEKNAFSGEETLQNEHNTQQRINENPVYNYPSKDLEIEDEAQTFKNVFENNDEYKNMKSGEGQGGQESLQMKQNQELKKFSVLNDDSVDNQKEPELYKTVSEAYNQDILTNREPSSKQYINEQQVSQKQDANADPKLPSLKSVSELSPDLTESLSMDRVVITNDQHHLRDEPSMRSSENHKEKMQSNENKEMIETLPISLDVGRLSEESSWQSSKTVSEFPYDSMVSISTNSDVITDDQDSHKLLESMRSSEKQEKMQSSENQEVQEPLLASLYTKNAPEDHTWQFFKSVPELNSDLMVSKPTDTVDITNDKYSIKEDESMRLSQIQNEKLQLNENQEFFELLPPKLDSENHKEDPNPQYLKSVPELQSDLTESLPTDKLDITNDQHLHRKATSMRLSENQNEKIQSNENQEVQEHLPERFDIDRHPEERSWQFPKSVDEMIYDPMASMPTNTADISDDQYSYKKDVSLRSSENQNEEIEPNENQEMPENLPMRFDNPEDRTWQVTKSVSEPISDLITSIPMDKVDDTEIQPSLKGEASTRLSQTQNEKLKLNEYQEKTEHDSTRLDIDNKSEDTTSQFFKSAPELQFDQTELLPTDKVDISNSQYSYREETSMRSSETQNEKIQLNENQEVREHGLMGLDIERQPEQSYWHFSKSVPELNPDLFVSMSTDKVDVPEDQYSINEEASMRWSQGQNENLRLNKYQEESEYAPTILDIENNSEDKTSHFFKSVPDLLFDLSGLPSKTVDNANDQREESSMRSSENHNLQENLPITLDNERHPEERSWLLPKSISGLSYDPMMSMSTNTDDVTDDPHSHIGEESMRTSENQFKKLQSIENLEVHKPLSTRLDVETQAEDRTMLLSKSVPELNSETQVLIPTDKFDVIELDNHFLKGEPSMRQSQNQDENLQFNGNQRASELLSMRLDSENHQEERISPLFKSDPELQSDLTESLPTDNIDIIYDQQSRKEDSSMRSSGNQNEKLQSIENPGLNENLPMRLDIDRHSVERSWQFPKSVDELSYDAKVSMISNTADITDDQHSHKEIASMRSTKNQFEKMQSNEYLETHEPLPTRSDIETQPDERSWQVPKSADELSYDPMILIPTTVADVTADQTSYKDKATVKSSENENENIQTNENPEIQETLQRNFDFEINPKDRSWQFSKAVPELSSDPKLLMPMDKLDFTNEEHIPKGEISMRLSETQNEKLLLNENQEESEFLPARIDSQSHQEEHISEFLKSAPVLQSDPTESLPTYKEDITDDQHFQREDVSIRLSENDNEKLKSTVNQKEQEYLPIKLDTDPEARSSQVPKSIDELIYDPIVSMITKTPDFNDEQTSLRSSENQSEKIQPNKDQGMYESLSTTFNIQNNPEDRTWQFSKSVSEPDPITSMPSDKADVIEKQHILKGVESMRLSDTQNEKLQLNKYQDESEDAATRLDIENNPEDRTSQLSKSVPELQSELTELLIKDKADMSNDQHTESVEASMRSSVNHYEQTQPNFYKEMHETLPTTFDIESHPEDRTWEILKSVSEITSDPMVSLPTDNVEIIDNQHSLIKGNERFSQNQNEITRYDDNSGHDLLPNKPNIENQPEHNRASQFFKTATEFYMTPSEINHVNNENNLFKEARLSWNQNEGQQINFNRNLYDPLWARSNIENNLRDDTSQVFKSVNSEHVQPLTESKLGFTFTENQNDNNEVQYPRTSLGLSNEYLNKEDNIEHGINNVMRVSQPQQSHENSNHVLQPSYERQFLGHNFKTLPENKMLSPPSQFEYRTNGQDAFTENLNLRINQQQSRYPEPENVNLHSSMRWNTENQHRDPSPKTFQSNLDFDHTLHRNKELDNDPTRPQLFGDHVLDNTQSSRWFQTKQHSDHFLNYYKNIPEMHEEYLNPYYHQNLHRVPVYHGSNGGDTFNSLDFPSSSARLHDHMQKYHQEKSSNIDSSMEPHMHMREPFVKSGTEVNNMHFNPHGTARFGSALPIAGVGSGAVGVFPTANAGGCGIPLLLSCSPSIVSGSLARPHIAGPVFKSIDENYKYYIKRNAKNIDDVPVINNQKFSEPLNNEKVAINGS